MSANVSDDHASEHLHSMYMKLYVCETIYFWKKEKHYLSKNVYFAREGGGGNQGGGV